MMKIHTTIIIISGLVAFSSMSYANNQGKGTSKQHVRSNKDDIKIISKQKVERRNNQSLRLSYTPPFLGAPSNRLVGMALRGEISDLLLSVLTPAHTGLSLNAQPNIYWYTSRPTSKSFQFVEFILNSDITLDPLLKTKLAPVTKGGIQKLRLSDFDIKLEPGVEYTWAISLVPDPTRSHDLITSGRIKYVDLTQEINKVKISSVNPDPYIFAKAGYWYDTLDATIQQIEKQPNNKLIRDDLVALFEQVGLHEIAKRIGKDGI